VATPKAVRIARAPPDPRVFIAVVGNGAGQHALAAAPHPLALLTCVLVSARLLLFALQARARWRFRVELLLTGGP
jgi:hypothetical protein